MSKCFYISRSRPSRALRARFVPRLGRAQSLNRARSLILSWPALRAAFLAVYGGFLFSACPRLCPRQAPRVLFHFRLTLSEEAVALLCRLFGRHGFGGRHPLNPEPLPSCYPHSSAVPALRLSTFRGFFAARIDPEIPISGIYSSLHAVDPRFFVPVSGSLRRLIRFLIPQIWKNSFNPLRTS